MVGEVVWALLFGCCGVCFLLGKGSQKNMLGFTI